jgi:hypothetical protein
VATERFIDLEHQRYADQVYEGPLPRSLAAPEQARAGRQEAALARLRARVAEQRDPFNVRMRLDLADLADLLTLLGLDE